MTITETCWAKERTNAKGATFLSGFVMLNSLKAMIQAAEDAGMNGIGMSVRNDIKTAKFQGSVVEITPFKLKPKTV